MIGFVSQIMWMPRSRAARNMMENGDTWSLHDIEDSTAEAIEMADEWALSDKDIKDLEAFRDAARTVWVTHGWPAGYRAKVVIE